MRFKSIVFAAAAAALLSIPAWAHHSHTNYNTTEFITLSGTITEVAWTNPHVWVYMEVADAQARPQMWALEGGSPTSLTRGGWQRNSMKAGDKVSVRCHRVRDGSEGCLLGFVTNINGTAMDKEFD
jgi:Family of unknown function (DUF6152)